jgi:hypothetical protein
VAESLEAFAALDQVRRELAALSGKVDAVEARIEQVQRLQMAELALTVSSDSGLPPEVVLHNAKLTNGQIGQLLGKSAEAVRKRLERHAGKTAAKKRAPRG